MSSERIGICDLWNKMHESDRKVREANPLDDELLTEIMEPIISTATQLEHLHSGKPRECLYRFTVDNPGYIADTRSLVSPDRVTPANRMIIGVRNMAEDMANILHLIVEKVIDKAPNLWTDAYDHASWFLGEALDTLRNGLNYASLLFDQVPQVESRAA